MDTTVVLVGIIAAAAAILSPLIPRWLSARDEKKKLKIYEKQQYITARRAAYHKFIQVFSTKYSNDSEKYLNAALDTAEFGNVVLLQPIKFGKEEISSLDSLIEYLIRLRTEDSYDPDSNPLDDSIPGYIHDEWGAKFDKLRTKAALGFSTPLMKILLR